MRGGLVCALLAALSIPAGARADDGPPLAPVPMEMCPGTVPGGPMVIGNGLVPLPPVPRDAIPQPVPPPPYPLGTVTTPGPTLAPDTLAPAAKGGRRPIIGA